MLRLPRQPFVARELAAGVWEAKWELAIPVFVVGLFLSGKASMVETAAAAFVFAMIVECFVTRDLDVSRGLPVALVKSSVLTGSVLILLSAAMGITSYIVDAQIPDALVAWVKAHIESRFVFLLALNAVLIVVGCLVDIFSAIVVLAPLLVPMAAAFGVHPVHLGVIFLSNLELGYLTPPVGLNLYLAASRFERPLTVVVRCVLPFLLLMALAVLDRSTEGKLVYAWKRDTDPTSAAEEQDRPPVDPPRIGPTQGEAALKGLRGCTCSRQILISCLWKPSHAIWASTLSLT